MVLPVRNNIRTATMRQAAEFLRAALPEDIAVVRYFVPEPPAGRGRVSVFPSDDPAVATVQFLGNGGGRTTRDETFTIVVSCETIGDNQDALESAMDEITSAVEDLAAEYPTLGDLDGMSMFGVQIQTTPHPVVQLDPGVLYQWVEMSLSARGRYD
jgi:hypothetical protein